MTAERAVLGTPTLGTALFFGARTDDVKRDVPDRPEITIFDFERRHSPDSSVWMTRQSSQIVGSRRLIEPNASIWTGIDCAGPIRF
jgi:hypothetical protein